MTEEETLSGLADGAPAQPAPASLISPAALQALSQQLEEEHRRYPRLLETEPE